MPVPMIPSSPSPGAMEWADLAGLLVARCRVVGRRSSMTLADARALLATAEAESAAAGTTAAQWAAVHGVTAERVGPLPSGGKRFGVSLGRLLETGWTPESYAWLRQASWVMHARKGVPPGWADRRGVVGLTLTLARLAEGAAHQGARWPEVWSWLVVIAGAPDQVTVERVRSMVGTWRTKTIYPEWIGAVPPESQHLSLAEWAERLGEFAGLSFAAGIDLHEAAEMHAAGRLDIDGLMTLAALNGYALF